MAWSLFSSNQHGSGDISKQDTIDKLIPSYSSVGVSFAAQSKRTDWLSDPLSMGGDLDLAPFLSQLEEQGLAHLSNSELSLTWQEVFQIRDSADYGSSFPLFALPPSSDLRPCLASSGSFSDEDFSIYVSGWIDRDGSRVKENPQLTGALIRTNQKDALLDSMAWQTLKAVEAFHKRKIGDRTAELNRMSWGEIRKYAKAARADLSNFLESTVVVTPDKLAIELRKSEIGGGKVIEVFPNFEGQPPKWLETFDRFDQIRDRYEVPHGEGLTHVVITPEVRTVLGEIKRMPARRVSGERAEAFVRNPFAALGPTADKVIDPEQFDKARQDAGITFARFTAQVERNSSGAVENVALLVEEGDGVTVVSEILPFADPEVLEKFITKVESRILQEAQCCAWQGNDLEILGDTPDQIEILRQAVLDWRLPGVFKASEIFDLSRYSERVEGFGIE